tara:strand:+ start:7282 stop:7455 length:174 start_codon:yes stop_codon:yes gene_type:complete
LKLKQIIPKHKQFQFKPEYLERSVDMEQRRIEIFKKLVAVNYSHAKAYEISKRRMKI